jgi:hypothetical protein
MKLTNKHNIPQTFVNVLERTTYSRGRAHISATQLINSPKIVALTQKFQDQLEQDVSDMVWSLFGSAVHGVLEHGADTNHLIEERINTEVDGWTISGAIDLQILNEDGTISIRDYKVTSAWTAMNNKKEWEQQLNIYAWLVESVKQKEVKDVGVVAIIRDWSRRDAARNPDYPQAPVKEIPISLWSLEDRDLFIRERIADHSDCMFAMDTDSDLPDCTPEQMWEKPTTWALKKTGNVRAKSIYETEDAAQAALEEAGKEYEIEIRPGERTRCATFCSVSSYCDQWHKYQEKS